MIDRDLYEMKKKKAIKGFVDTKPTMPDHEAQAPDTKIFVATSNAMNEAEVWDKPNPVKNSKKLTPAQKAKAKARAAAAGRPYPNMVDNIAVARSVNEAKSFDKTFAAARAKGLDKFTWQGKEYTTKLANEKPKAPEKVAPIPAPRIDRTPKTVEPPKSSYRNLSDPTVRGEMDQYIRNPTPTPPPADLQTALNKKVTTNTFAPGKQNLPPKEPDVIGKWQNMQDLPRLRMPAGTPQASLDAAAKANQFNAGNMVDAAKAGVAAMDFFNQLFKKGPYDPNAPKKKTIRTVGQGTDAYNSSIREETSSIKRIKQQLKDME